MAGRFREEDDELEQGMPGSPESRSIIDKIREMVPSKEDIQDISHRIIPQMDVYKQAALAQLGEMGDSFNKGIDDFVKQQNAMTPEEKAEQALGMVSGAGGIGTVGKMGNVLKTEVPIRFRQILNSPKVSGIIDEVAPFLKGKESLAGKMAPSSPEIQQLKNVLNQHYNELGPTNQTTQILQKLLSRYSK